MDGLIDINDEEFQHNSQLVYQRFGINLTEKKRVLVRGRLNKLLQQLGYKDFDSYYNYISRDKSGKGLLELVDKISTNHTFFFREKEHFEVLKNHALPHAAELLKRESSRDVRVWCAGCATGEEAYTLAIVLAEYFGVDFFKNGPPILATDISLTALEKAMLGMYGADRLSEVPKTLLQKYFVVNDAGGYTVKDSIKRMIVYKRLNFKRETFPFRNKFHTIFCRNVMIYFDQPTKEELVAKFARHLVDGGYFFIGHSESLGRSNADFQYVQPAVYRKKG
ncbi:MAG: CheR family methyltransferase [Sediminispirochaetaceae bacterium]